MPKYLQLIFLCCLVILYRTLPGKAQAPCNPTLENGLEVRLPFNEKTGTVASALPLGTTDGQLSTGAIWRPTDGMDQQGALELPGAELVHIPILWRQPTSFTISWWVKPLHLYNHNINLGNGWGGWAFHSGGIGSVYVGTSVESRIELLQNIVQVGVWQHFVFTLDGGVGRFYKNGQLLATKPGMPAPFGFDGFTLRGSPDAGTLGALYDEFRIYSRAVTDQEAQDLYTCRPVMTCSATGSIRQEQWSNIPGSNIAAIPLHTPPTTVSQLTSFEIPTNSADNYGTRIRGYICPPQTGAYTFWIAGDDEAQLWLSSDETPATKVNIASVPAWTNPREWNRYPSQQSAPIQLVAGKRYYIEALHKEESGGDNLAVAWRLPNGVRQEPIPGDRLSPYELVGPTIPLQVSATPASLDAGESSTLQVKQNLFGHALTFTGGQQADVTATATNQPPLLASVTNNFTIEAWVNPTAPHEIDWEGSYYGGTAGQKYLVFPQMGEAFGDGAQHAGMGISVGTNGISVYEHAGNYMPAVLVWPHTLVGWNHIAVVYENRVPKLFVNGTLVKIGLQVPRALPDPRSLVHPSTGFGGGVYGNYEGQVDELRIWNSVRTATQLAQQRLAPLTSLPTDLVGYWRCDEGQGTTVADATGTFAPATLSGATLSTWQKPSTVPIAGLRYQWSPTTGLNTITGTTVIATPSQTTTYTVNAITDDGGTGQASVQVTVTGNSPPPSEPSEDRNRHWTLERTFDGEGNIIGESKQFFDALGRPTQGQTKQLARKHVLASQAIYGSTGQPALSTLAAPTNNQEFKYKEGFVTTGGQAYTARSFEDDKADSPAPVDAATVPGTLGYYYSENNTLEPYTAATHHPYSLIETYKGPIGGIRRAAGPGDELRMGQGRETKGREMPLLNELTHYMSLRPHFVPSSAPSTPTAVYRLNAGGGALTNSIGAFAADQYFTGGNTATTSMAIAGTNDDALYQSERVGTFTYALPVSNGQYQVILHFAETYWGNTGQRVFDVALEGTRVLTNYDIYRKAGYATATTETFTATITDGVLTLDFLSGTGGVNDPKVDAIEVLSLGAATPSLRQQGIKSVSIDVNGRESITFTDKDGLLLATCLSGSQYPGVTVEGSVDSTPNSTLAQPAYLDIHIPAAGATLVTFSGSGRVQIRNLYDGTVLNQLVSSTATVSLNPGFYRIRSVEEAQTFSYVARYGNFSYSYYDNAGRPIATVAPNGVNLASNALPSFVTRTTYSADGDVLSTSSTDEGTSEFVYAKDGRIRFSQSALQKQQRRFSYTNYDDAGRAVESGEYLMDATPGQGIVFENHLTTTPAINSVLNLLEDRSRDGGLDVQRRTQRKQVWYDLSSLEESGTAEPQLNGRIQEFVLGGVVKTKNETTTTWYSYDDLGLLTWMVQEAPVVGIKTVDYTYDLSGNVLEVAYQKGQPDAFYHHYRYDADKRLSTVHTSPDGQIKTLQAKYVYYLHGPLKRVELADRLQGIDYTYTLQGWLKSINHVEPRRDPGQDAPRANGVPKDLFGLTLDYFTGDYRSQPLPTITTQTLAGPVARYDGTVRDAAWRTASSADKHLHTFHYDEKTQLLKADYHKLGITGTTYQALANGPGLEPYQEGNLSYDANGNIGSMRRRDGMGGITDDFAYRYLPNTNKLAAIHGQGSTNGPVVLDYEYDVTGQMTRQRDEQGQRYLQYNVEGKVTGVYKDQAFTQPLVTFTYDDRGFRACKVTYAPTTGQLVRTTYYVRDQAGNELSTYEQEAAAGSALNRTEVPLYGTGRVGMLVRQEDGTLDARYELNDQLGNARVVFHKPTTTTYLATMVPSQAQREEQEFTNIPATRFATLLTDDGYVARLNAGQGISQGPSKLLPVEKGDTITLSARAYFHADGSGRSTLQTAPLLIAGAAAQSGSIEIPDSDLQGRKPVHRRSWLGRLAAGLAFTGWSARQATPPTTGVLAYLRYQFKDANGNVIDEQYEPVSPATPDAWQALHLGIRAKEAGTLHVSVVSEDPARVVYFDDIQVEQTGSTILQEQHTYAYGAPLTGLNYVVGNKRYRYGYQGQFAESDPETGWESFELRLYNSRIGRWMSYDPYGQFHSPYVGMGNNPVSGIDPDGGWQGPIGEITQASLNAGTTVVGHINYASNIMVASVRASLLIQSMQTLPAYIAPPVPTPQQQQWSRWANQGDGVEPVFWEHNFFPLPPVSRFLKPVTLSGVLAETAASRGGSKFLVPLLEETFEQALANGAERIGVYSIYGTKGLVGSTFNRNIFLLEADKGAKSLAGFRSLVSAMEKEAIDAGANKISIYGGAVVNDGFLNPKVASRFGYSFEKIGKGVILQKNLKP